MLPMLKDGRSRRFAIVVAALLLLLGLSQVISYFVLAYDNEHWSDVLEEKCSDYLDAAKSEFSDLQRETRRVATGVGQNGVVMDYLSGRAADQAALFDEIAKLSRSQGVGVEVYDRREQLVAWGGRSGPQHRRDVRIALDGQMTSFVTRTPISSQLYVSTPVREEGTILGAILARRTIEIEYPINDRFLKRRGLAERLTRELGVSVDFEFGEGAELRKDGRYASAVLYGIDSARVGVVSILKPARSAFLESVAAGFQVVDSCLLALLIGCAGLAIGRLVLTLKSLAARALAMTALIWLARYALLWIDIPSLLVTTGIFDPANFASEFGDGLAKSIGETTLTVAALTFNILYLARIALLAAKRPHPRLRAPFIVALPGSAALVGLIFWLLRGYGAVIRSAVFDSTLSYNDPRLLFPSFELGVMMLDLFLIGFCMIVAAVGGAIAVSRLLGAKPNGSFSPLLGWGTASALFLLAAPIFGIYQETPLMSTPYRLFFAVVVVGFAFLLQRGAAKGLAAGSWRNFFFAFALGAALLYPLLNRSQHDRDHQRVETFAREVLRPVDNWFKFVVDEALQGFASDETTDMLTGGGEEDVQRLAFTRWAKSYACREGYTCVFALADSSGAEVSRFTIGGQTAALSQVEATVRFVPYKDIRVKSVGTGINAIKIYAGSIPIRTRQGELLGYGRVAIAAAQQTLFREERPAILRGTMEGTIASFYRPIMISEFHDGVLQTTGNSTLPVGYSLPGPVKEALKDSAVGMLWASEVIDNDGYETLFARRDSSGSDVVGLSLQDPGVTWHLIGIVKVIVSFAIASLGFVVLVFGARWLRGERPSLTFRGRLLIALLVTAIVPLALIALYGRIYGRQHLMETTSQRLSQQTAMIVANITDQPGGGEGNPLSPVAAEDIAADVGTDFNLYAGNMLSVSSRPELYEVGILDRRMSGGAYANVVIKGKRFYLETESIGRYNYAVGFRPVLDTRGKISGVVSVPTLYRLDEAEIELARRNAFLVAVYAVVLLSIVIIASAFANRIAAPIQRLTEATRRISRGDLEVDLHLSGADAEIGELVRSFESMTRDLKRSREELIRFERELAWKEMAKQVAHEIKNPLTPIRLSIQHLRQTFRDNVADFHSVLDQVTKTVIDQIDALSRIASEFSHFARMPERRIEPCDVNTVVSESIQLFARDGKVLFNRSLAAGLPPVPADREELRRAFINVIRNAIQAMNNAGAIEVSTERNAESVLVTIRDHGPGIPEEIRDKLFQPNFSTKTDGMGLGLAIVRKTIEDLGGDVWIESTSGEGTTVCISLPLAEGENDSPA